MCVSDESAGVVYLSEPELGLAKAEHERLLAPLHKVPSSSELPLVHNLTSLLPSDHVNSSHRAWCWSTRQSEHQLPLTSSSLGSLRATVGTFLLTPPD
jgi:hypothetical protein